MQENKTETQDGEQWNPMSEEYFDPNYNKYTEGLGAEMDESLQPVNIRKLNFRQTRVKIHVKNIPDGLNEYGLRNLLLRSGKPLMIYLPPNNPFAFVEFATPWEAELAIRDLNEAPPYNLKVSFARAKDNETNPSKEQSNNTSKEEENSWDLPPVYYPKLELNNQEKTVHGSKILKALFSDAKKLPAVLDYKGDPGYYQFNGDDFSPSVGFYQLRADVHYKFPSISRGRSYYNIGNVNEFTNDEKVFTGDTGIQKNKSLKIRICSNCSTETFKLCQACNLPLCSTECLNYLSHYKSCGEKIEKFDLPEKSKPEYIIPECLEFNNSEIDLGQSVFENFKSDTSGIIKFTHGYKNVQFGCVMLKDDSDEFVKIAKLKTFKESLELGKVGQFVLVPDDEDRGRRGIILSKGEQYYRVALIDTAEVISVKTVYEAPAEALDIASFGCKLIVTEEVKSNFIKNLPEKGGRFFFEVAGPCKSNQWPCTLKSTLAKWPVAKVLISKWIPNRDLECVKLKNKSIVVMTMYCSTNVVYIRPDDEIWKERFILLNNEVAFWALKSRSLGEPPIVGDMYCARLNENKCFYRAVVMSVDDNFAKVAFVDYGNEQTVKFDDLRPLPEALKRVPCFAVKVVLKYVPNLASDDAITYLNDLICGQEELTLKFDESISNQVQLLWKDGGEDVNRTLANKIMPGWMKDKDYKSLSVNSPVFEERLAEIQLTPGVQDLYLLHFDAEHFSSSGRFWVTTVNKEIIGLVYGDLKKKLEEYCESFGSHFCYLPRKKELCCALYEGEWLRGSFKGNEKTTCSIFFIDYGFAGTVETVGLRRMREEFLDSPALAIPCVVEGYEKWKDKPDLKKQVENYMKEFIETKLKDVNVIKFEDGAYVVSINHIEKLIQASEMESSKLFEFLKSQEL